MLLRDAESSDLPALVDLQQAGSVRALGHVFPQDRFPFPREAILARWAAEIADPDVSVLSIDHDGRLAGFAALRADELLHFGMAVDTWGTGLAAMAHDHLLPRLAVAGRPWLRVFEENHRARRFYEKMGWRRTGRSSRSDFPPHPILLAYEYQAGS
jgi:RimJ/RimL family protein N-acetyltransferase